VLLAEAEEQLGKTRLSSLVYFKFESSLPVVALAEREKIGKEHKRRHA